MLDVLSWNGTVRNWTDADRKLSEQMSNYWVTFARTGNPNAAGLPIWPPPYDPEREQVMLFGDSAQAADLPNKARLDFLAE